MNKSQKPKAGEQIPVGPEDAEKPVNLITNAIDRLSFKRQAFAREFTVDGNATQAAIRAGYASNSAQQQSTKLLLNPLIAQAVRDLREQHSKRLEFTKEFMIDTLWANHKLALTGNPVLDRYGNPTGEYVKQISSSNKALDQINELLGYKLDRKAVVITDVSRMSDDALEAAEAKLEAEIAALEKPTIQ